MREDVVRSDELMIDCGDGDPVPTCAASSDTFQHCESMQSKCRISDPCCTDAVQAVIYLGTLEHEPFYRLTCLAGDRSDAVKIEG